MNMTFEDEFNDKKITHVEGISTIEEALEDFRQGKMLIVIDDPDRENEGDLTMAAEFITPEAINFMATHGKGLICLPMLRKRLEELNIPLMVPENSSKYSTAFTVSIDGRRDVTTGISAADRARTINICLDPAARPDDLVRPGHIFPLMAREGGVLVRAGQTEAGVDLSRLAGLYPAAVICEIMKDDGTMARLPDLIEFSRQHDIKIVTVEDLIEYRMKREQLIQKVAETYLPLRQGHFRVQAYKALTGEEHIALSLGEIGTESDEPILVRVHSQCLTGDVFGSLRCDCGSQLQMAIKMIGKEGRGVLLYLMQEGRGIGLLNKLKAYELQDGGLDTVEANEKLGFLPDQRDYGIGAQILRALGVKKMRLITNNPRKFVGLRGYGLSVVEVLPIEVEPCEENIQYLRTKQQKLGHRLTKLGAPLPAAEEKSS
jgi:3,4-dihydroxy 2-butanone 4-phosphate synthase / GTP cyclohydrolase II